MEEFGIKPLPKNPQPTQTPFYRKKEVVIPAIFTTITTAGSFLAKGRVRKVLRGSALFSAMITIGFVTKNYLDNRSARIQGDQKGLG